MNLDSIVKNIDQDLNALALSSLQYGEIENQLSADDRVRQIVETHCRSFTDINIRQRIEADYLHYGPLEPLLSDTTVTEILIQNDKQIVYEKNGCLEKWPDAFLTNTNYQNALKRLFDEAQIQVTLDHPLIDGSWREFRLNVTGPAITRQAPFVSLRRHPENPWTLESLYQNDWCTNESKELLRTLIAQKKNLFVIGTTGAGKTSVLNALLHELPLNERVVTIEDSSELRLPTEFSTKLMTRFDPTEQLKSVTQAHLIKQALRMRPDRLVVGEVRGEEAKDFLMAISTGHAGSWGTIHASDPQQALIRLEMLIQLGAPQWSLDSIRRLIQLSLDYVIVCKKENGKRLLGGVYRLVSLEESGFLIEHLV